MKSIALTSISALLTITVCFAKEDIPENKINKERNIERGNQLVRTRLRRAGDSVYYIWMKKKDIEELRVRARGVDSANIFTLPDIK